MHIPTPAEDVKGGDLILLGDGRAREVFDTSVAGQAVTIRFYGLDGNVETTMRAIGSPVTRVTK